MDEEFRRVLSSLISRGREYLLYGRMLEDRDKAFWRHFLRADQRLDEYVVVKKQWEHRIPHQMTKNSKFTQNEIAIKKDVDRMVTSQTMKDLVTDTLKTLCVYSPELGFAQGMVDLALLFSNLILDNPEENTIENQAALFSAMDAILFNFGQIRWYQNVDETLSKILDTVKELIIDIFPRSTTFLNSSNGNLIRHCIGIPLPMMTRHFSLDLIKRLFYLVYEGRSVDPVYIAVITSVLITKFPEITQGICPEASTFAGIISSPIDIENDYEFLALVTGIYSMIDLSKFPGAMKMEKVSLRFFHPLEFPSCYGDEAKCQS